MEIQVNGEKRHWDGPVTVLDLLEALGIHPATVAVERNLRIVLREGMAKEMIHDGDKIEIIRMMGGGGMLLIINDHVDIALAVEADGVHLGQEDLPLAAARAIAPDLLIGISTHSREEALKAQREGADYVNIGPIFPTRTKEGVKRFLGPEAIAGIAAGLEIPFTVMGGINGANIDQVLTQGARRVAVVTAVTMADDVAGTIVSLREKIRRAGGETK